jgi:hypothetical protein
VSFAIIVIVNKKSKISVKSVMHSQSDMHNLLKRYAPEKMEEEPDSQLKKHARKNSIKVMVIENKAYWVADNIFYSAELIKNSPDFANAEPVDTSKMSQQDVDKMMFVLDNLKRG